MLDVVIVRLETDRVWSLTRPPTGGCGWRDVTSHGPLLTWRDISQTTSDVAWHLTDHFWRDVTSHRPLLTWRDISQTTSDVAWHLTDHFWRDVTSHRPLLTWRDISQTTSDVTWHLTDHFWHGVTSHRPLLMWRVWTDNDKWLWSVDQSCRTHWLCHCDSRVGPCVDTRWQPQCFTEPLKNNTVVVVFSYLSAYVIIHHSVVVNVNRLRQYRKQFLSEPFGAVI